MLHRDIVVIGASAGGIEPIRTVLRGLDQSFPATIFIVLHISADSPGYLPTIFDEAGPLPASGAKDGERFKPGRVYVAVPDRHLLLNERGCMDTPKGPRENRVRPAIDPLFRSAALAFGPRVIGVVLSGGLDDGTAGLRAIKMCGGMTIVQDPNEALVSSMPVTALHNVSIDYCRPAADLAPLLMQLVQGEVVEDQTRPSAAMRRKLQFEIDATKSLRSADDVTSFGDPSLFTCPECHGTLTAMRGERPMRYRCHTGHAFTVDSLLAALSEATEVAIWNSIRSIQESAILLTHLADHWRESDPDMAEEFDRQSEAARRRAQHVREAADRQEFLTEARAAELAHSEPD